MNMMTWMTWIMTVTVRVFGSEESDHQKSTLNQDFLNSRKTPLCSHLPVRMNSDLKVLLQQKKEKENEDACRVFEEMSLCDLAQETVKFGTKFKGKSFQTAYEDTGYVEWFLGRYNDGKGASPEIKALLIFIRRMSKKEAENQPGREDHQEMRRSFTTKSKVKPAEEEQRPESKVRPADHEDPYMAEAGVRTSHQLLMDEMRGLDHRMIQMEGELTQTHLRVTQLEQAMQEMMYFIQTQVQSTPTTPTTN